jgi:hypothetical protein
MSETFLKLNALSLHTFRDKFMQILRKHYKTGIIFILSLFAIILIAGSIIYAKREALLVSAIDKGIRKAKTEYNLNVKIGSAAFSGLSTVNFTHITVVPQDRDSLAHIENFKVGVKLLPLLFGDIKLSEITVNKANITLIKKDTLSNYDFLFRKRQAGNATVKTEPDLAKLANDLINRALYKIPDNMDIADFIIRFKDDTNTVDLHTTKAIINKGEVSSTIQVNENESIWHVQGTVDPGDKQLNLMLFADDKKVELPYLEDRFGLKLIFDTVKTEIWRIRKHGSELSINGSWSVKNLVLNHPQIAGNDIIVSEGALDANMLIGKNFVSLDSTSTVHLRNIQIHPFLKYTIFPHKTYEMRVHTPELDAQELLDSFPEGLFESLEGMQVAGKLRYDLDFFLDSQRPDDVIFISGLKSRDFKVTKWGKTNLQKINSSFTYTPYEYGRPMRNIIIGPANPDFTPLEQISPDLKNAVLTAEDPSFFSHNGFVEEAFRSSIATNFKEKSFKRGGSTISMQLVKNVYLNRQKTLARKIEEILIVWIIENNHLSTKHRMFETYLNLIEWGRNVYGIGEASYYYFGKHPSQLNLGESIYLASIIPRPKSGLYRFEGDGSLRESMSGYFRLIGGLMASRGFTQSDTTGYGFYSVRLKESMRSGIPVVDSLTADSIMADESDNENSILEQLFIKSRLDTIHINELNRPNPIAIDTVLSPAEQRRERREQRRRERNEKKQDND